MKKLFPFLSLFISLLNAGTYRIEQNKISDMNLYNIFESLRSVPEISPLYIDASDIAIQSGIRSSVFSNSVVLAHDGVPYTASLDGRQWHTMKPFSYHSLEYIEVHTGVDAWRFAPGADIVINAVSSDKIEEGFSLYGKTYVGSEVGDPAIYKNILASEEIPQNKDQILAGEGSVSIGTETMMHTIGLDLTLHDYYSNRLESERENNFGDWNSHQSLNEHFDPMYRGLFSNNKVAFSLNASAQEYRSQRFVPYADQYNYYDGRMITIQPSLKITINDETALHSTLSVTRNGGTEFRSQIDSTKYELDRLYGSVGVESNETGIGRIRAGFSIDTSFGRDRQIIVSAEYTPESGKWSAGIVNLGGIIRGSLFAETDGPDITVQAGAEKIDEHFRYNGELIHRFSNDRIKVNQTLSLTSEPSYRILFDRNRSMKLEYSDDYEISPSYSGYVNHELFGEITGFLSFYQSRLGWRKSFAINNITFSPEMFIFGPTYWGSDGYQPMRYDNRDAAGVSQDAGIHFNIAADYRFGNDRFALAMALKNIGRKHYDLPHGNYLGMLLVTNITIDL